LNVKGRNVNGKERPYQDTNGGNLGFEAELFKAAGQAQGPAPTVWQWPQHILDILPDRLVESESGGEIVVRGLRAGARQM
jgi:hypothetical protein